MGRAPDQRPGRDAHLPAGRQYTIAVTVTDNLGQTGTGYQRVTIK